MKKPQNLLLLLVLAALPLLACTQGTGTETASDTEPVLPFIEDDYETALAEARARDVPMFVESWAPW
jgi:hypothetical protein